MDIFFCIFKTAFIKLLVFLKNNFKWVLDEGRCTINLKLSMQN